MTEPKIRVANLLFAPQSGGPDDDRKIAAGRLMGEIVRVIEQVMAAQGVNRRELARRLGRAESTISRQLDDAANLSVERIADFFWALDDQPYLSSVGLDCLTTHGRTTDFRPTIEVAAESSDWLKALMLDCQGSAISAGVRALLTPPGVSPPSLTSATAGAKGLRYDIE